jgi:ubiquinone/menaquinone biosynthesis C-methylase UbiE
MKEKRLEQEWNKLAPSWVRLMREDQDQNRTGLLDHPMLAACGDIEGKHILDCGCGEGRFCRMLVERGAGYILGLDLCSEMIHAARELKTGCDDYRIADVQDLGFLENETFDLAVSYLNQCDLPDFNANNREVFRVLKPGGRFICANLHPMRSAAGSWHKSPEGEKLHAILDHYFDETERYWKMLGCDLTNFHRSLSTYVNGFLEAGFNLDAILEPSIEKERINRFPGLEDELRVPTFIIYLLSK